MENKQLILTRFGENVVRIRKSKGLSQRGLESKCKVDYASISRIENGKLNITLTSLVELARGLGVSPKKLLDF